MTRMVVTTTTTIIRSKNNNNNNNNNNNIYWEKKNNQMKTEHGSENMSYCCGKTLKEKQRGEMESKEWRN